MYNIYSTIKNEKDKLNTTPGSLWLSSQKSKKISEEVRELLVEEHSAEGQKQEKSIPDHRHSVEMPEPSTDHTEDRLMPWGERTKEKC